MLCDAHNHLHDESLRAHRPAILSALDRIGLGRAVVNGTTEADWPEVEAIARDHAWIIPSYGLHPWFIGNRTGGWKQALADRLAASPCAVGEIGLDRARHGVDFEDQKEVCRAQLALAGEHQRPVTIHCVKAWGHLEAMLGGQSPSPRGIVLHAYSGPSGMVPGFVHRGAYFSFNAAFLHPRHRAQRETFRLIPIDRLLVETDAPAMPPPTERTGFALDPAPDGRPLNHPANIAVAYEGLAEMRGLPLAELAARVEANFARLFGD